MYGLLKIKASPVFEYEFDDASRSENAQDNDEW